MGDRSERNYKLTESFGPIENTSIVEDLSPNDTKKF